MSYDKFETTITLKGKRKMEILFWIIAIGAVFYVISLYNRFVKLIQAVNNTEKEIDIQLDRRGKVFDSLISSVKAVMKHEEGVFAKVVELRNQAKSDNLSPEQKRKVEGELSEMVTGGGLSSALNVTMEAYPQLRANENMMQLQEEIVSTENKLSFSKKAFNSAIEEYNIAKESFPSLFIPKFFNSLDKNYVLWGLTKEAIEAHEERRVEFN
jgi:LemA protein